MLLFVIDIDDILYLLPSLHHEKLVALFDKSEYKVSILKKHIGNFVQEFLPRISHLYPIDIIEKKRKAENKIPVKQIKSVLQVVNFSKQGNIILLEPCLRYENNTECNVLQQGTILFEIVDGQVSIYQRDKETESTFASLLLSFEPMFSSQSIEGYFYVLEKQFTEEWIKKTIVFFRENQIMITGLNEGMSCS